MKIKTIPPECLQLLDSKNCPPVVIEFIPVLKRNVGIGWVQEGEATYGDFKQFPVVIRPWINPKGF